MKTKNGLLLASVMAIVAMAGGARAAEGPCAADIQKFCGGIQPGGGRIVACLKSHETDLSAGCRDAQAKAKETVKEAKTACEDDIHKFCANVQPGGGRIAECLRAHRDQLSDGCKSKMSELHAERKGHK